MHQYSWFNVPTASMAEAFLIKHLSKIFLAASRGQAFPCSSRMLESLRRRNGIGWSVAQSIAIRLVRELYPYTITASGRKRLSARNTPGLMAPIAKRPCQERGA